MPTYEYECENCGDHFDAFHGMLVEPLITCKKCGKDSLVKLIGSGAAAIVKGTENPCTGRPKSRSKPKDRLGEGKNKLNCRPWWRENKSKIDKDILKDPTKYIQTGEKD